MADIEKVINELESHVESALAVDSDYVDCVRTDLLQTVIGILKGIKPININVNEKIKVKLSAVGVKAFIDSKNLIPSFDDDGYTTFQLWEFMQIYGQFFILGSPTDKLPIMPLEIIKCEAGEQE